MKILIFTEGTAIMHKNAKGISREERVEQSKLAGIRREEKSQDYESSIKTGDQYGSVHDYASYIPNGDVIGKLKKWKSQGAKIVYLTSRRTKKEIGDIKRVLEKYDFPDYGHLYFRQQGEEYKDVVARLHPDIFIEDDCESIGGEKEMAYPHIDPKLKGKIKSIVVKEFEGIDHLPDNLDKLKRYNMDSVSSTE